jgi:hypothetical protein
MTIALIGVLGEFLAEGVQSYLPVGLDRFSFPLKGTKTPRNDVQSRVAPKVQLVTCSLICVI